MNKDSVGMIIGAFLACAIFGTMISSCTSATSSGPVPVNQNSFEHRYATERFKAEGYNNKDAQQAADAVTKFLRAQEAQRNR
jgi:hypothetical protein